MFWLEWAACAELFTRSTELGTRSMRLFARQLDKTWSVLGEI